MEQLEANVRKAETQIERWKEKIDELSMTADEAGWNTKLRFRRGMDELISKHDVAKSKLDDLRTASGDQWEAINSGVELACADVEVAFRRLPKH